MSALLMGSTIRRAIGTVRTEAKSTITAIPMIAKSLPTQAKQLPHQPKKLPKEEISIPTTNLRLFPNSRQRSMDNKTEKNTTTPAARPLSWLESTFASGP